MNHTKIDAQHTVGTILAVELPRDAIHFAVAPVIAQRTLRPGQHAGADGLIDNCVGVVDPFLKVNVKPGERFWLFLYPNTITSLRHDWTHPSFADSPAELAAAGLNGKALSEKWMRAWAVQHMSEDYYGSRASRTEDESYESAIEAGHNTHIGPWESAADQIDDEWWSHWETITGKRGQRGAYFSCSC